MQLAVMLALALVAEAPPVHAEPGPAPTPTDPGVAATETGGSAVVARDEAKPRSDLALLIELPAIGSLRYDGVSPEGWDVEGGIAIGAGVYVRHGRILLGASGFTVGAFLDSFRMDRLSLEAGFSQPLGASVHPRVRVDLLAMAGKSNIWGIGGDMWSSGTNPARLLHLGVRGGLSVRLSPGDTGAYLGLGAAYTHDLAKVKRDTLTIGGSSTAYFLRLGGVVGR